MQIIKISSALLSFAAITQAQSSNSSSATPASTSIAIPVSTTSLSSSASTSTATSKVYSTVNFIGFPSVAVQPIPFKSRNYSEPYVPESFLDQFKSQNFSTQPHFQVFEEDLAKDILGEEPELLLLLSEPGYSFAFEAPIYFQDGMFYFCSSFGGPESRSDNATNNKVFSTNLTQILDKISSGETPNYPEDVQEASDLKAKGFYGRNQLNINSTGVQGTNGGTPYEGKLLLATNGRTEQYPGGLALVDRHDPSNVTVLVNQAFGKQFNSLDDVVVHPTSGAIFFTDPYYGYTQGTRPSPGIPQMTWRFDPKSQILTALDDTLSSPNGLVLSEDGKKLYISDSGSILSAILPPEPSKRNAIYVFDVNETEDKKNQYLSNRRLFAWSATSVADGVKIEKSNNLYTCCTDGVTVYSPSGVVIFKIFLPEGCTNLTFGKSGTLLLTAGEKIWMATLSSAASGPDLESLPK